MLFVFDQTLAIIVMAWWKYWATFSSGTVIWILTPLEALSKITSAASFQPLVRMQMKDISSLSPESLRKTILRLFRYSFWIKGYKSISFLSTSCFLALLGSPLISLYYSRVASIFPSMATDKLQGILNKNTSSFPPWETLRATSMVYGQPSSSPSLFSATTLILD